jgi:hypothetical protein
MEIIGFGGASFPYEPKGFGTKLGYHFSELFIRFRFVPPFSVFWDIFRENYMRKKIINRFRFFPPFSGYFRLFDTFRNSGLYYSGL